MRLSGVKAATLCATGCLIATGSAYGAAGHLDRSFGDGGLVTAFKSGDADGVTTAARGRVVAVGRGDGFAVLMRYTSAGRRDRSFSRDGKVRTGAFGGRAVAMDSGGRILTAGSNGTSFNVARYLPNGHLDRSFSGNGTTTTDMGGSYEVVRTVAVDSKGRIVLAGYIYNRKRGGLLAIARYRPNGSLDDSFGTHGKVTTSFPHSGVANQFALDSKDRIVAAGVDGHNDFDVARYGPSGRLDRSFGGDGSVSTDFGTYTNAKSVVIDRQDRIVAAGQAGGDFALARYRPSGRLDKTFGTGGKVITDLGEGGGYLNAAAIGSRGRIVVAGRSDGRFALVRYRRGGILDRSFSDDGLVRKPGGGADALAIDSHGRPVAAGFHANQFALARYKDR